MLAIAEHDAHAVLDEAMVMASQRPQERVEALDRALQAAAGRSGWLDKSVSAGGMRPRIERQRRALQEAVEAGLLEPARLAAELRLFD